MPIQSKLGRLTADAREALRAGDLLRVCDIALDALQVGPDGFASGSDDGFALAKMHVLAHARMGNTCEAVELYRRYRLADADDLDAQALEARLAKDEAFATDPLDFNKVRNAARIYLAVYGRFRDPYPGINAASLLLIAGDQVAARKIALELLAVSRLQQPADYYDLATVAEAMLILGRLDESAALIARAAALPDADLGSRSTTARQFGLIGAALKLPPASLAALLAPLAPPAVAMFSGPEIDSAGWREDSFAAAIDRLLAEQGVGIGYGSLCRGTEIVIAERLLARNAELNVVLPVLEREFEARFVGMDSRWDGRFRRCIERAATVTVAADSAYVGDRQQLRYGSVVAAGLARLRALQLDAAQVSLDAWQEPPRMSDMASVSGPGVLPDRSPEPIVPGKGPPARKAGGPIAAVTHERAVRAILFADFPRFSRLAENVLPAFWDEVMRRIAGVLDRHGNSVDCRNTWGDAVYAVVDTARNAAFVAVEMLEALSEVDQAALGLEERSAMRVGAHLGPVYVGQDAVTGMRNYFGTQVSRAARIEPITPPGAVFVTEQFAAVLALEEQHAFSCTYVGRLELPKGHGPQRMYRLARASPVAAKLKRVRAGRRKSA